ncbi:MAG: hypothetical protein K9H15_07520, partial [Bacteroidales bacterium]|nr:hypothetical protein [Bacteroidales bacterium]
EELNLKGEMTMEEFRLLIFVRDELRKATPYSPDSPEFDSIFKSLLSSKVQRYFEGYAPISASNFEPRIWKFEVLTESSTFNDLRFRIQEALLDFDKGSESDIRKSFEQTLRDLADVYVGESAGKHGDVTVGKLFEEMIAVPGITFSKKYNDALDIKIKDIDPECPVDYLYTISDALAYSDAYLELVKFDKDGTDAFINFIAYWIKLEYFPFMDQE